MTPNPLALQRSRTHVPSGHWIAREFAAQLQAFGVSEVTLHPFIRPDRLAAEQVALGRYALPKGSKTTNWVRRSAEHQQQRLPLLFPEYAVWDRAILTFFLLPYHYVPC